MLRDKENYFPFVFNGQKQQNILGVFKDNKKLPVQNNFRKFVPMESEMK